MTFFGPDLRNGLPIGLGSVAGFGIAPRFSPASLFTGGVQGAWYDPSDPTTLFSDRAGTTPCGTPGGGSVVPVGLMLDKSKGLVLGSELVTNGDFSSGTTGWSAINTATLTAPASALVVTNSGSGFGGAEQAIATVIGTTYRVTCTFVRGTSSAVYLQAGTTSGGFDNGFATSTSANGSLQLIFRATATTTYISLFNGDSAAGLFNTFDNVSLRTLAGNHAIAANDTTARPELSARVNLLTYSEQFDNAAWTKDNATVTANAAVAPDGATTADKLVEAATTAQHFVYATVTLSDTPNSFSIAAKAGERSIVFVWLQGPVRIGAYFDLSSGTITSTDAGITSAITDLGNGWYRCRVTRATITAGTCYSGVTLVSTGTTTSYTGNGTSGVYIWGADLRPANIGTTIPAYQRIADQYTYDAVGFPRYLAFNGTSSAMSTPANVNLSGTDKATVFAGVRRLANSDGCVVELTSGTVNALSLYASILGGGNSWFFSAWGTSQLYGTVIPYNAPITNVLTEQLDKAAPTDATKINARVNATAVSLSYFGSIGTAGTFANAPLFIGSRNNASLFFNGNIYSLVVVGSAVSAGNISSTETWVAGKVGITI